MQPIVIRDKSISFMNLEEVCEIAAANGLVLTADRQALLSRYAALLLEWNQKLNLISRKDEQNIFAWHFLHSLTLAMPMIAVPPIPIGARVLDLGTGGGLPGIPLKIARPDLALVLCDSIGKKISAVSAMLLELGLTQIEAVCSRVEDLVMSGKSRWFDVVTCRAVAPLEELVRWSEPLLKHGGLLYALKGGALAEEISIAERARTVQSIIERPLALSGFDDFVKDEKKLVIVRVN